MSCKHVGLRCLSMYPPLAGASDGSGKLHQGMADASRSASGHFLCAVMAIMASGGPAGGLRIDCALTCARSRPLCGQQWERGGGRAGVTRSGQGSDPSRDTVDGRCLEAAAAAGIAVTAAVTRGHAGAVLWRPTLQMKTAGICPLSHLESGRGERIRTSGLYVPNVALYQAKLHPAFFFSMHPARDRFEGAGWQHTACQDLRCTEKAHKSISVCLNWEGGNCSAAAAAAAASRSAAARVKSSAPDCSIAA